jgi:dihydrofolate reductase
MRTLTVITFLTLDGVMQAPGGPEEDPTGDFKEGGWTAGYWGDAMGKRMDEYFSKPFDLLLGRKTYEIFAAHWPYITSDSEDFSAAKALNGARKYVASKTLKTVDWNNSQLLEGDAAEAVKKLKLQPGSDLLVYGSGNLVQTLIERELIDQYSLMIFPVVIGRGKRLFGEGTFPAGLELKTSQTSTTGVVMATYEPKGEIKTGSLSHQEPSKAELERRTSLQHA